MSGCEKEVVRIGKQIEKLLSKDEDSDAGFQLLQSLRALPISLEVLQKTRIGMSVNNLRKQSEKEEVINLAKLLIKKWKKLLPAEGGSSSPSNKSSKEKTNGDSGGSSQDQTKGDGEKSKSSSSSMSYSSPTNDVVRDRCKQMLVNALKVPLPSSEDDGDSLQDPEEVAGIIEECIFTEFMNTDLKYKNRIRSRVLNLQDPKNPSLRRMVLLGAVSPEKIATMTTDEMASDAKREERKKFTKEAINEHQLAQTEGTKSNLLKCGKCGKKNTTYNQMQTRSADEPMTTFVFCNNCGHRWKFC